MKLDLQEKLGNIDVKFVFSGFSPVKLPFELLLGQQSFDITIRVGSRIIISRADPRFRLYPLRPSYQSVTTELRHNLYPYAYSLHQSGFILDEENKIILSDESRTWLPGESSFLFVQG